MKKFQILKNVVYIVCVSIELTVTGILGWDHTNPCCHEKLGKCYVDDFSIMSLNFNRATLQNKQELGAGLRFVEQVVEGFNDR